VINDELNTEITQSQTSDLKQKKKKWLILCRKC